MHVLFVVVFFCVFVFVFFFVNNFSRSEYGDACNHGNWNVTIKPLYIKNDSSKKNEYGHLFTKKTDS